MKGVLFKIRDRPSINPNYVPNLSIGLNEFLSYCFLHSMDFHDHGFTYFMEPLNLRKKYQFFCQYMKSAWQGSDVIRLKSVTKDFEKLGLSWKLVIFLPNYICLKVTLAPFLVANFNFLSSKSSIFLFTLLCCTILYWYQTKLEQIYEILGDTLVIFCEKPKIVSLTSSIMTKIVVSSAQSIYLEKNIFCTTFQSASSVSCLLKVIVIPSKWGNLSRYSTKLIHLKKKNHLHWIAVRENILCNYIKVSEIYTWLL